MLQVPKIRRWAYDNALTLIYVSALHVVTWILIIIGVIGVFR